MKSEPMEESHQILRHLEGLPRTKLNAGDTIFEQGRQSGFLVFLVSGTVEVVKDGMIVDRESRPGDARVRRRHEGRNKESEGI